MTLGSLLHERSVYDMIFCQQKLYLDNLRGLHVFSTLEYEKEKWTLEKLPVCTFVPFASACAVARIRIRYV
jgi:hypothetical protein